MPEHRYVKLRRPWNMTIDVSRPQPARYCSSLMSQALRNSLPARRRAGVVQAAIARRGLPSGPVTAALRARRRVASPALDQLRVALIDCWPQLAQASSRLPAQPPELATMLLPRSAGDTVFVFGAAAHPLVVCKVSRAENPRAELEHDMLALVGGLGVAPRALGKVGQAWVQEGLPGEPLLMRPLRVADAGSLEWLPVHQSCVDGLRTVAAATCVQESPVELACLREDLRNVALPSAVRTTVHEALDVVDSLGVSSLRHGDTSPQNCLVQGDTLVGLVDWEWAQRGAPGFDIWNLTLALLEQGLGLVAWSDAVVLAAFKEAWACSPFFRAARSAARGSASEAGVPADLHDALEVAFFARRVARRVKRPAGYAVGPQLSIDVLTAVCSP